MKRLLALLGLLVLAEPASALTCSFSATPTTIAPGQTSKLAWRTTAATKLTINGSRWPVNGELTVKPLANIKYNLVATDKSRHRCLQSVTVALSGEAPPGGGDTGGGGDPPPDPPPPASNVKTMLFTGGHAEDNDAEMAQWMRDNVINVTPTSKRPDISSAMSAQAALALAPEMIAANIKVLTGIGGPLVTYYPGVNTPPVGELDASGNPWKPQNHELWYSDIQPFIDNAPARNQEYMYADEPWAACYGFTYEQRGQPAEIACTVRFWNAVRDEWKKVVPNGKFGLCLAEGDARFRQLELLRGPPAGSGVPTTGLQADFVCDESYGSSSTYHTIFDTIHAEFPNVELVALQDGTLSVCQLFDTYYTPANVTAPPAYPITVAFWDVNDYFGYRGQGADKMFLLNALELKQTGERQFCKQPTAAVYNTKTPAGNWQSADIEMQTYNNKTVWHPQAGIEMTKCEYRVRSYPANGLRAHMPSVQATATETVPWTEIPCFGDNPAFPDATYKPFLVAGTPVKITVGAGKDCRHNGVLACQVETRGTNNLGKVGHSVIAFYINHNTLPNYDPTR